MSASAAGLVCLMRALVVAPRALATWAMSTRTHTRARVRPAQLGKRSARSLVHAQRTRRLTISPMPRGLLRGKGLVWGQGSALGSRAPVGVAQRMATESEPCRQACRAGSRMSVACAGFVAQTRSRVVDDNVT
eukprot:Rmarinus@m.1372